MATQIEHIEIEEFIRLAERHPLFDVRTPAEFEDGHIPGAINLPLFDNDERAKIGTLYKKQGRQAAILQGLDFVGPKMREIVESVMTQTSEKTVLLHCWRGGMRSGSVAWLLSFNEFRVILLKGGYKAYRHHVLDAFRIPLKVYILSGYTGSGKTAILHSLQAAGEQIIDLEGLANHKGSSFGALGEAPQPTQQQFENDLAVALRALDPSRPVWLEDESKRVGWRIIPEDLWTQMRDARVFFLDMPAHLRVERLIDDYGSFSETELASAILRLEKRLGNQNMRQSIDALAAGDLHSCTEILLRHYYDKTYLHGITKRNQSYVSKIDTASLVPEENARLLIEASQSLNSPAAAPILK